MASVAALKQMKSSGRKIVAAVVYDYQMAQVADRAGVDIVSAGDSVGVTLWGQRSESDLTLDEMLVVCRAVRRGVARALVSCDVPLRELEAGGDAPLRAATRLAADGGTDLVKIDAGVCSLDALRAVVRAGIPVWAQLGVRGEPDPAMTERVIDEARALEASGAALLDFRYSGPTAGPAVVGAVAIPVIGGLGGGPWLDGRVRSIAAAIGYLASAIDDRRERYANVGADAFNAIATLCDDVRAGRPLRGEAAARRA